MALDAADLGEMVRKLREKAQAEHAIRISPEKLNSKHHDILLRAINNTLHSEIALFTYAQIIDGLPIADVAWDRRQPGLSGDHPIDEHEELCPGSMDKAVEYCGKWKLEMLSFNPKVRISSPLRDKVAGLMIATDTRRFRTSHNWLQGFRDSAYRVSCGGPPSVWCAPLPA